MSLNERQLQAKKLAKKKRREARKLKLSQKKKEIIYKPAKASNIKSSFIKSAWNNTVSKSSDKKVLEKKMGFDKQAWNNDERA